jgi:hypothetical protein
MGMWGYLKALLGLEASTTACHTCGAGVPARDLAKGLAVVLARRPFCRRCVAARTSGTSGRSGLNPRLMDSTSHVTL